MVKKCGDCFWMHEFPFFKGWHECLCPKNKGKSTRKEEEKCNLFEQSS